MSSETGICFSAEGKHLALTTGGNYPRYRAPCRNLTSRDTQGSKILPGRKSNMADLYGLQCKARCWEADGAGVKALYHISYNIISYPWAVKSRDNLFPYPTPPRQSKVRLTKQSPAKENDLLVNLQQGIILAVTGSMLILFSLAVSCFVNTT